MQRTGRLTFTSGFSRLDGTRLMKGALDNDGFERATTFLRQDRQLKNNQQIWVEGIDDVFQGAVIVITDAGPVVPALIAVGAGSRPLGVAASKSVVRALSSRSTKTASKSKPAKKSAKKSRTRSTKKSAAKKSR